MCRRKIIVNTAAVALSGFFSVTALAGPGPRSRPTPAPDVASNVSPDVLVGPGGDLAQWLVLGPVGLPGFGPRAARLGRSPFGNLALAVPGRPVQPSRGRPLRWNTLVGERAVIDLRKALRMLPAYQYRAALLGLMVESNAALRAYLQVGYDDGLAVWLNGKPLLSDLRQRSYVADARLVALPLRAGQNRLVLQLAYGRGRWRIRTRLFGPDHQPLGYGASRGRVRLRLPAVHARKPLSELAAAAVRLGLERQVTSQRLTFAVTARAPAGLVVPPTGRVPLDLRVSRGPRLEKRALWLPARALAHRGWSHAVKVPAAAGRRPGVAWLRIKLRGRLAQSHRLWEAQRLCERLQKAEAQLRQARVAATRGRPGVGRHPTVPPDSWDTVAYHLQAVRHLLKNGDQDARYLARRLWWASRWLAVLVTARDPFPRLRGRITKAYRSPIDGRLQPYSIYVPRGYRGRRPWPLYVMLHGMYGDHRQGLSQLLGVWMPKGDRISWQRFLRKPSPVKVRPRALIVAPQGFGDAFYHHLGERDVSRVVSFMMRHYKVDPRRVILVGHSMGATGALDLGVRFPGRYAGVVALAGYHTRWIHREIRKGPLTTFERFVAQHFSPVNWAANGRQLPLIAVHGTRDGPWTSKVAVQAWKRWRNQAELKLFQTGHDVWRHYLDQGQIYRDTAAWRNSSHPRRVVLRTSRMRWRRAWWVQLDGRPRSDGWSEVIARAYQNNRVKVTTRNVDALTLHLDKPLIRPGRAVTVILDGAALQHPARPQISFHRQRGQWRAGLVPKRAGMRKRPGLEGPLDDIYYGPVLVVVGTRDPAQRAALLRVGRRLTRFRLAAVRYPLKLDTQITAADRRKHHLILVGGPLANRETARYARQLPIRISSRAVSVGRCNFAGPDVGTMFIHPNPEAPDRYLVVVAGTTALGPLRAHRLPRYLPDFVVFDRTIERGDALRILGPGRRYRAAGFFDRRWRVPRGLRCGN